MFNRSEIKQFLEQNKELYANLTKIAGSTIDDLSSANSLFGTLKIEASHGYYWDHVWTKEEELDIIGKLSAADDMKYTYSWNNPISAKFRAGGLIRELNDNMQKVLNNETDVKKLFVYSTHDTMLSILMHALNIFNNRPPTFGAALYLELHESSDGHSVRAYYHNETEVNTESPHLIRWTDCSSLTDCPIEQYFNLTKHLLYDDYEKECGN